MADNTHIEWADATWNVWTGCTEVSPGCKLCYAKRLAATRMKHLPQYAPATDDRGRWTNVITVHEPAFDLPLRWTRPRRIFVNAQSDTFHEDVPGDALDRLFTIMALSPRHAFMALTKRAERMRQYIEATGVSDNVQLGVSVENADYLHRVDTLRATPASVRFLSLEPLLGPIPRMNLQGIDGIIVGGESCQGSRFEARPMHPDWVRGARDQCAEAGVAFFFKQWGEWAPDEARSTRIHGWTCCVESGGANPPARMRCVGKRAAGRILDGRTHDDLPGGPR